MTVADWTSFGAALAVALTGSLHCIGMCGGFALSASLPAGATSTDSAPPRQRVSLAFVRSQLLYHLGKTTSYVFLGVVSLWTGSIVLRSSSFARGTLFLVCGTLLLLLGAASLGWNTPRKAAGNVFVRLTRLLGWQEWTRAAMSTKTALRPVYLGMLSGLLPCPLVWAFLAASAVSNSLLGAIGPMLALGLGTTPALALVGLTGRSMTPTFGLRLTRFSGALLILLGCWTFYRGFHPSPACCS